MHTSKRGIEEQQLSNQLPPEQSLFAFGFFLSIHKPTLALNKILSTPSTHWNFMHPTFSSYITLILHTHPQLSSDLDLISHTQWLYPNFQHVHPTLTSLTQLWFFSWIYPGPNLCRDPGRNIFTTYFSPSWKMLQGIIRDTKFGPTEVPTQNHISLFCPQLFGKEGRIK